MYFKLVMIEVFVWTKKIQNLCVKKECQQCFIYNEGNIFIYTDFS